MIGQRFARPITKQFGFLETKEFVFGASVRHSLTNIKRNTEENSNKTLNKTNQNEGQGRAIKTLVFILV